MRLRKNLLSITGVYLGPPRQAKKAMRRFLCDAPKPTNPIETQYIQKTFIESVEILSNSSKYDVFSPKHSPNFFKVKSFYINKGKALNETAINVLVDYLDGAKCTTLASFDLYGGDINDVYYDKTSFIHRNALYCLQLEANWKYKERDDQCVKEINDFGKEFQSNFTFPFSYQGFIDRELDNLQVRYYGNIFGKLIDIKKNMILVIYSGFLKVFL